MTNDIYLDGSLANVKFELKWIIVFVKVYLHLSYTCILKLNIRIIQMV